MQKSMRFFAALSLVGLTTFPVLAERPTIEYFDLPSGFSFTLSGVCSFDVFEELLGNKEKIATFYNQNGEITFQVLSGVNERGHGQVHRRERIGAGALLRAARQRHRPRRAGWCVVLDVSTRCAAARLACLSADQRSHRGGT
jgi:hypothetical protein